MKVKSNDGFIGGLALTVMILAVVAIIALVLDAKFYSDAKNYKNNDQQMIAAAVATAKQQEDNLKNKQFAIESENPYLAYKGPSQYGSVNLPYPKDWSGYIDTTGGSGNPVEGYFEPGLVPAVGGQNVYALRLEINANNYSNQLAQYTSEQQSNKLTITPFAFKQVPSDIGVMIQGQIQNNINELMVMVPLRTNTLKIWTESMQYASLLTNQILPNVTFSP